MFQFSLNSGTFFFENRTILDEKKGQLEMKKLIDGQYIKAAEMTYSYTAHRLGINNEPEDDEIIDNINYTIERLDDIRQRYGIPVRINSGYRCPALNKAVGGVSNSQHCKGQAADLSWDANLFSFIVQHCKFDQLIEEQSGNTKWIHISFKRENERNQITKLARKH